MKRTRGAGLAILILAVLLGAFFVFTHQPSSGSPEASTVGSNNMQFEIAVTQAAQERGLGGRAEIPDNYGMLFVVSPAQRIGIWMKDMLVPIDIIWLTAEGTIMLIDAEASPATYPHVFYPPQPVSYVLETRSGFAASRSWTVGTRVMLPQPYGE